MSVNWYYIQGNAANDVQRDRRRVWLKLWTEREPIVRDGARAADQGRRRMARYFTEPVMVRST
ncbi:MAG: hypothetical protein J0J15_20415, partial [Mesorhizobium sp.]|nr:hypothetical protein [Mesorhizobium sp.]